MHACNDKPNKVVGNRKMPLCFVRSIFIQSNVSIYSLPGKSTKMDYTGN